ncbi:hypothetical protein PILCRDRAFT_85583 [Piloderma croceum F 1598]|uniref:Uncharacterized protein n=1 Tax=Piloderma croceum (strain F 1598) TaxID=765440 RepID=A0A0C3GCU2_PILCF|nr:hypothetical protein PILCRDRAFT_85583 [Piloderma croceum F 1598]
MSATTIYWTLRSKIQGKEITFISNSVLLYGTISPHLNTGYDLVYAEGWCNDIDVPLKILVVKIEISGMMICFKYTDGCEQRTPKAPTRVANVAACDLNKKSSVYPSDK